MAWFAAAQDVVATATALVSGANDWLNFFQLIRHANTQEENQAEQLKEELSCLKMSLLRVRDLIDCAEWWIHKETVDELLCRLKDVVYDAEDLIHEFDHCELKRKLGHDAQASPPCSDSMKNVTNVSISKVKEYQRRLDYIVRLMKEIGLHEELQRLDPPSRLETTSCLDESQISFRKDETARVIELLGVPIKRKRTGTSISMRESNVSVLPIVGIGGIGKTTLAQQVCNDRRVQRYFGDPIWICVSYKFDEKKLAREFMRSATGEKMEMFDSTDLLQRKIRDVVMKRRFLLVLDDMWDDVCSNEGEKWQVLLRALSYGLPGSMILVTTRSEKVAELVATTEHFQLDGLSDATFWSFFMSCIFSSGTSEISPELELIAQRIVSKLKGSPLAAKTLGRLLSLRWDVEYWSGISECELWDLPQNENDILPALRSSYQYLPSHLKRCFLICALYPKGYMFDEESLICIWTASGLLEAQAFRQIRDVGHGYLQDLLSKSFFQRAPNSSSKYVIHSLMHDMAQVVSRKEYCMIKDGSDLGKVPENIRHLSIFPCGNIDFSSLMSLSRCKKLRSLVFCGNFESKDFTPVVKHCFQELRFIRFLSFTCKLQEIPENIGNLKLLRYLGISSACKFQALPLSFCSLYNLEILNVPNVELLSLPEGFINLVNLKMLKSVSFEFCEDSATYDAAKGQGQGIRLLTNMDQIHGSLKIENLEKVRTRAETAEALSNKKHLESLTLSWKHREQTNGSNMAVFRGGKPKLCRHRSQNGGCRTEVFAALPQSSKLKSRMPRRENDGSEEEVIEGLSPHANLKFLEIQYYGGESMPNWLQPEKLPNLRSLRFHYCGRVSTLQGSRGSRGTALPKRYLFLTSLTLEGCTSLSSIQEFLQPEYLPAIRILSVISCPRINWQRLSILPSSLEKLVLDKFGKFTDHFVSNLLILSSLDYLHLSCPHLTSIPLPVWSKNLTALEKLKIHCCASLASIEVPEAAAGPSYSSGMIGAFSSLSELDIFFCQKLSSLDELLVPDYLPAIKTIKIGSCADLVSLPVEKFRDFVFLENLEIFSCRGLGGQRGRQLALPSSIKRLYLAACGDISGWIPSCLHNLSSLMEMWLGECPCVTSLPRNLWSDNLAALKQLVIWGCQDLTSIGGAQNIAHIQNVYIEGCPELEEFKQPFRRGYTGTLSLAHV
ncbi:hypothetical protein ACP70R_014712 [Stipagrostis hirtigluma subsp. patula]